MKYDILRAAEAVKHTHIYVPGDDDYVQGFASQPADINEYRGDVEPVVAVDEAWSRDKSAMLTVNHYNAVVLNSRNMLIADVDIGDSRLSQFAGIEDEREVIEGVQALRKLDESFSAGEAKWKFSEQSYRVYRTRNGCRVICTSRPFERDDEWHMDDYVAYRLMLFLKADREYMRLCEVQNCYRARLTPKPWRCGGSPCDNHVCDLIYESGKVVHPLLGRQLEIHDGMTLACGLKDSTLA